MSEQKYVIVIDQTLPAGIIANTAAVLSLSVGKLSPEIVGDDFHDGEGRPHRGITTLPVPVLKGCAESVKQMRESARQYEPELMVIDLASATRTSRSYQEYQAQIQATPTDQLEYQGIALYGPKKLVNRLTGNLGLLR
ncbi:DUF2000 domain-containing protein [Marinobacterium arenosum]|uniref:DUF2000 domain-containing protein n=1 Tax=Marinobacterium arenosum TaxID=2862496 RepID=UPI001C989BEA|nr:DUF2000 domain-containing protein [Marinobacterium arenosum]MBY4675783.1 DUF2000 domain-containing protein [Marinobacterium arenosum]